MKNFRAAVKSHAGGDEKHDINFHWPYRPYFILNQNCARLRYRARSANFPHWIKRVF
jgi:hypothetical protein